MGSTLSIFMVRKWGFYFEIHSSESHLHCMFTWNTFEGKGEVADSMSFISRLTVADFCAVVGWIWWIICNAVWIFVFRPTLLVISASWVQRLACNNWRNGIMSSKAVSHLCYKDTSEFSCFFFLGHFLLCLLLTWKSPTFYLTKEVQSSILNWLSPPWANNQ